MKRSTFQFNFSIRRLFDMLPNALKPATLITFDRLADFHKEIDRLFNHVQGRTNGGTHWIPPVDIVETDDAIAVNLEVPGLESGDIDVHVEDNTLTISGEKKQVTSTDDKKTGYRLAERRYGRFQRSFSLPDTVEADAVTARYTNGVLTITLPRAERVKPRKVTVEN
jgi:HSP20 family protein